MLYFRYLIIENYMKSLGFWQLFDMCIHVSWSIVPLLPCPSPISGIYGVDFTARNGGDKALWVAMRESRIRELYGIGTVIYVKDAIVCLPHSLSSLLLLFHLYFRFTVKEWIPSVLFCSQVKMSDYLPKVNNSDGRWSREKNHLIDKSCRTNFY